MIKLRKQFNVFVSSFLCGKDKNNSNEKEI